MFATLWLSYKADSNMAAKAASEKITRMGIQNQVYGDLVIATMINPIDYVRLCARFEHQLMNK